MKNTIATAIMMLVVASGIPADALASTYYRSTSDTTAVVYPVTESNPAESNTLYPGTITASITGTTLTAYYSSMPTVNGSPAVFQTVQWTVKRVGATYGWGWMPITQTTAFGATATFDIPLFVIEGYQGTLQITADPICAVGNTSYYCDAMPHAITTTPLPYTGPTVPPVTTPNITVLNTPVNSNGVPVVSVGQAWPGIKFTIPSGTTQVIAKVVRVNGGTISYKSWMGTALQNFIQSGSVWQIAGTAVTPGTYTITLQTQKSNAGWTTTTKTFIVQ